MRRWMELCFVAALITIAAAAGAKNQETRGVGKVRVIHNFASDTVPQPAAIDVRFGKNPDPAANTDKLKGIKYGTITKYLRLKSPVTVGMFLAGTTTQLFSDNLGTIRKQRMTLLDEPQSSAGGAFMVQVLDDSSREPKRKKANVRMIHGSPTAATGGVKLGVVGGGFITDALTCPDTTTIEVNAGSYTLGVFPPSDPRCTGTPLAGLTAQQELNSRSVYTVI